MRANGQERGNKPPKCFDGAYQYDEPYCADEMMCVCDNLSHDSPFIGLYLFDTTDLFSKHILKRLGRLHKDT